MTIAFRGLIELVLKIPNVTIANRKPALQLATLNPSSRIPELSVEIRATIVKSKKRLTKKTFYISKA